MMNFSPPPRKHVEVWGLKCMFLE